MLAYALFIAVAQQVAQPISPNQYVQMLGKGLDVDWSKTVQGMRTYSSNMPREFKQAGLGHVRLRVKNETSDKFFKLLDRQIQDCLDAGLIPVLAYQADDFKKSASNQDLQKVVSWWKTVAAHYQSASPRLSFDLVIEVTDAMNKQPELLNSLYEQATAAIRETNPTRNIFISPRVRSSPEYLKELQIPSRANGHVLAEWHFFAAGPSKTNPLKQWTTGTDAERKFIRQKIQYALDWQAKTGLKSWVGAWMPGDYNDGNTFSIADQVSFARFMAGELDKAGIPFAVNSDRKFYDRDHNRWIAETQPVLQAFLHP